MSRFIFLPGTAEPAVPLGGKAGALLRLHRAGIGKIPRWFTVLPVARLKNGRVSRQALAEIDAVVHDFPGNMRFAVRSSAQDEDGSLHSFAGQLDSFLSVPGKEVGAQIEKVWRSGFGARVMAYCKQQGLPKPSEPPVVIVQEMVDAAVSGVAFGSDPLSGRRGMSIVSGTWGLGTALVGGEVDADTWQVTRDGRIAHRHICEKRMAHAPAPRKGGVCKVPITAEKISAPSLNDGMIVEIAELARMSGKVFGQPQDIEWAVANEELFLLQSRPMTALSKIADPDGVLQIWDNSNIAESFNGISSPLTFSFARRVYEEVYRELCRILSVPESRIVENADTFRRMLGYIQGRVYYNLASWYRVLSLLPGFQINRSFMEQMMGVKESIPPEILRCCPTTGNNRWIDLGRLARSTFSLAKNYFTLETKITAFHSLLDQALTTPEIPLSMQRPEELAAYYRELESKLLAHWNAPLLNDFFAMIFHGVLRKLTLRWCDDTTGKLSNELIATQGGIISAEPVHRLRQLATLAARDANFCGLLQTGSLAELQQAILSQPEFAEEFSSYLKKFGGRCLEELKLETSTLDEDPLVLLRSIGRMAINPPPLAPKNQSMSREDLSAFRGHPLRGVIFRWVLRNTRARVRDRENLRFERTRVFGRVRQIFQEIGRRFYASQKLDSPNGIFLLGVDEILGVIDGTALSVDLRALCALRKVEQDGFEKATPANRFETRGAVQFGNAFAASAELPLEETGDVIAGIGCSPGKVRGRARVITDPKTATIEAGEILVASRTDPGWILLFPQAAGLLVEFGSLLSHSAIVSREIDLPAIVAIPGLCKRVKTGEWLEMDGAAGTVRRISP